MWQHSSGRQLYSWTYQTGVIAGFRQTSASSQQQQQLEQLTVTITAAAAAVLQLCLSWVQ
jgi:hypothetical protein